MTAPDRSWTIAPTLMWFGVALAIGLWFSDGNFDAVADRLTTQRESDSPGGAGPGFTAAPVVVAEAADDPKATTLPVDPGDRSRVGALEDVCLEGASTACKRWGMDGFYRAMAESKQGKLGRAVRVSWYGDSVIATDAIPGRLRSRLQGELGDGGPGFVYIVPPHRFCVHEGINRSSGGGWIPYSISTAPIADGLYGFGGSTTESRDGHATIKLVSGTATHVELYYLAQPRGGTATITSGSTQVVQVQTAADAKQAGYATGVVASGTKKLELTTTGKVRLFGMSIENASGAVVDNLGVVSVNVKSFANNNEPHFISELGHRNSDLVMIMIGANEAAWLSPGDKDTKAYQARYETVLAPIRKARPDGACLVVSPTDQAEAKDGKYPSRTVMPALVDAQRKAAHAAGCAFYSTYDWMGGRGSAASWFKKGLVSSDFQHLSRKGANKMADAIHETFVRGFKRYGAI